MSKKIVYISVCINVLLALVLVLHWQFISLKYTWRYTPSLPCDILRMAYTQRFEPEFKPVDAFYAAHPDGTGMTDEVRVALRKMEAVQTKGNKIQQICEEDPNNEFSSN